MNDAVRTRPKHKQMNVVCACFQLETDGCLNSVRVPVMAGVICNLVRELYGSDFPVDTKVLEIREHYKRYQCMSGSQILKNLFVEWRPLLLGPCRVRLNVRWVNCLCVLLRTYTGFGTSTRACYKPLTIHLWTVRLVCNVEVVCCIYTVCNDSYIS